MVCSSGQPGAERGWVGLLTEWKRGGEGLGETFSYILAERFKYATGRHLKNEVKRQKHGGVGGNYNDPLIPVLSTLPAFLLLPQLQMLAVSGAWRRQREPEAK